MKRLLQIDPADNVAVALTALEPGEVDGVTVRDPIPQAHKVSIRSIPKDSPVIKYAHPIGLATTGIPAGAHVHTHNVASSLTGNLTAVAASSVPHPPISATSHLSFLGYKRRDGRAATRNEIWIVNTVGCVNRASELIASAAAKELANTPNLDGVHAFPHPFGCSQLGDDLRHTQKVLAGLINHPNAAAALVLGLGCENNQMRSLLDQVGPVDANRVKFFNAQDVSDEVESGVAAVRDLAAYASQFRRESLPLSSLTIAMKCGGSDGLSGVTANPLVGRVADRLTAAGATVVLSEVPEMFGAEDVLLARAASAEVSRDFVSMINDFRAYFRKHNQPIDENPSPGNKDGGITTLAEKSLGCVQKGGTRASVKGILPYASPATPQLGGLALVNAPGNDGVSSTAMTVAGATLLCFTTGRGTPMGFPVPTVKISTNTDLATRKPQWIDFDAGPIAAGADLDAMADRLLSHLLAIASGTRTRNEEHGYREIAIWKDGVTL